MSLSYGEITIQWISVGETNLVIRWQCAKKVVSDSSGLVDFAIGLVNPVLNLPKGKVKFFGKFKLQKNCNQCCSSKIFLAYLTLSALRVISIKFLFVISMLGKTEWSWELPTWSHMMNLLDVLSTSPHYFSRKWIGATNENSNFDRRV